MKIIRKLLFLWLLAFTLVISANAKRVVKISVTPTESKISIDGNYVGDGIVEYTWPKKTDFIVVKIEREGYLTLESKIFYSDKRDAVSYVLRPDLFFNASVPSGIVNKFFTVTVSPEYYTMDEKGKIDSDKCWKMIHQILLNYFEEMQVTDQSSSFIQTPWYYERFVESKQVSRTRVTVKQSGVDDDKLVYQIKISSEQAPLIAMNNENSYTEVNRILKKFESLISEFQTRLSKK